MLSPEHKIKEYVKTIDRLIADENVNPVCTPNEIKERIRAYELAKKMVTQVWFSELFEEVAA